MIRNIGKAAFLATAVIAAGTAFVNCSKRHTDDDIGSLTLALTLSPGVVVNTVSYTITGNGQNITGNIDVSMATAATAFVSGLPVGTGYLVKMHADSTDNMTHCDGQANFDVALNTTVAVTVNLQCRGPRNQVGQVAINGRLDNCPFIGSTSASSLQAVVGNTVNIAVAATDYDATDVIQYSWTVGPGALPPAGAGTFGSATAASTTFRCTAAGNVALSIAITDTICGDSLNNVIPITCLAGGTTGAAGTTGTAGTGGTTGAAGGGGAGTTGTAGGGGAGTTGTAGTGGGGSTGTGGTGALLCSNGEPFNGNMTACCDCQAGNCSLGAAPATDGCAGLTDPNDRTLCLNLFNCIAHASPACTGGGDPTNCFCGSNAGTCFTTVGAANGVCAPQFIAAAKTTDPVVIQQRFVSPLFPIGRAVNLSVCDGSFCGGECAIP